MSSTIAGEERQTISPFRTAAYHYIRVSDHLPTYAEIQNDPDPLCRVKLFGGSSATWWVASYDPETRVAFGVAEIFEREIGDFSMEELVELRTPPFRLPIERDLGWEPRRMSQIMDMRDDDDPDPAPRGEVSALAFETDAPNPLADQIANGDCPECGELEGHLLSCSDVLSLELCTGLTPECPHYGCPDGWHHGEAPNCSCTPDCALEDEEDPLDADAETESEEVLDLTVADPLSDRTDDQAATPVFDKCRKCGQPLTDAYSRSIGLGRDCRGGRA